MGMMMSAASLTRFMLSYAWIRLKWTPGAMIPPPEGKFSTLQHSKTGTELGPGQWHPASDKHLAGGASDLSFVRSAFTLADYSLFER
jgi:hypothetical protein